MKSININRMLVENTLELAMEKGTHDLRRSLRSLMDMGTTFGESELQRRFIRRTYQVVERDGGSYYELIRRVLQQVDRKKLLRFVINVGYECCSRGAARLRKVEETEGFNVPWALNFYWGTDGLSDAEVPFLVAQGYDLGIRGFGILDSGLSAASLGDMLQTYPDCAFAVLVQDGFGLLEQWRELESYGNLVLLLDLRGEQTPLFAAQLKENGMFYGMYRRYGEERMGDIFDQADYEQVAEMGSVFYLLVPSGQASAKTQQAVRRQVEKLRTGKKHTVLLLDAVGDLIQIDQAISKDACGLCVAPDGSALTVRSGQFADTGLSATERPLRELLAAVAPKAAMGEETDNG